MSERYSRLFTLPENLYTAGSPVVIAAGALLKDNQTGKVIAQLKMRNISPKPIKAAKVSIHPLDTVGNPLGGKTEYQYLDLSAARDEDFGQKVPVALPDAATRAFTASVEEIVFADNSIWTATGEPWEVLDTPGSLRSIGDAELIKQFRLKYGNNCKNLPLLHKDLWYCACGELNRQGEAECHRCKKSLALLEQIDMDELRKERDIRVAAEKEQAEKEAAAAKAHAKKMGKIAAIVVPILAILIVVAVLVSNFIEKKQEEAARMEAYNTAVALMDAGQYEEAMDSFIALGDYKDCKEQIEIIKNKQYDEALLLYNDGKYEEAIFIFDRIESFKDSNELRSTAEQAIEDYNTAINYLASRSFENNLLAYQLLQKVGNYKDAEELLSSLEYVHDRLVYSSTDCYPGTNFPTFEFFEGKEQSNKTTFQEDSYYGYIYPCEQSSKSCNAPSDYISCIMYKFTHDVINRAANAYGDMYYCDDNGNWIFIRHIIYPSHYVEITIVLAENIPEFIEDYKAYKALW